MLERQYWPCPFCEEGQIEVVIRPRTVCAKRTALRGGKKISFHKVREEIVILSEKCNVCGKTAEQIEKKWKKEGVL